MRVHFLSGLTLMGLLILPAGLRADPAEEGRAAVRAYLAAYGATGGYGMSEVSEDYLSAVYPGVCFFGVQFIRYPVTFEVPKGVPYASIFVYAGGGLLHLRNAEELRSLLQSTLPPVTRLADTRAVLQIYLRLLQEYVQDGYFRFVISLKDIDIGETKDGGLYGTGRFVVTAGGEGFIWATVIFDRDGQLVAVAEEGVLKEGLRPGCQATKLLDNDPAVRQLAEQFLLGLGDRARPYLAGQRAKAAPELQYAIDRLWQRIVDESWE